RRGNLLYDPPGPVQHRHRMVRRLHGHACDHERVPRPVMAEPPHGDTPSDGTPERGGHDGPVPGSADRAVSAAAERSAATGAGDRNVGTLAGLPVPDDTANLRQGPDLNPALLALLPLVGVWR